MHVWERHIAATFNIRTLSNTSKNGARKKDERIFDGEKCTGSKECVKKLVSETVLVYSILRQYLISHEWHCIELSRWTLFTESWLESQVTDYFQLKYSTNAMNAEFLFSYKNRLPLIETWNKSSLIFLMWKLFISFSVMVNKEALLWICISVRQI